MGGTSCTILSYNLYWDQGTGVWASLVGNSAAFTATTYTFSSGVVSGTEYKFKVRAKNKHGYGSFSPEVSIFAGLQPSDPTAVVTAQSATYTRVSWTAPADNGLEIRAYDI
mmetsp:Transcript_21722/g.16029  ORF Transcript_21722/g.16029 Transcript_21722/m.16029 type:complete len:111 (-) Transcript_21722:536-868(-)